MFNGDSSKEKEMKTERKRSFILEKSELWVPLLLASSSFWTETVVIFK